MSTLEPQVQAAISRGDHKTEKPPVSMAQQLLSRIDYNMATGYGSADQPRQSSSRGAPTNKEFQWAAKPKYVQEDTTIKKENVDSESKVRDIELRTTVLEAQMVEVMGLLKKHKVKSDSGKNETIVRLQRELLGAEDMIRSMTVRLEQARQQADQAHQKCLVLTQENTHLKTQFQIHGVTGVPLGAGADLDASFAAPEQDDYMAAIKAAATAAPTTASAESLAAMEAVNAVGSSASAQSALQSHVAAPLVAGPPKTTISAQPSPSTSPVRRQVAPHRTQSTGLGHQAQQPQQPQQPQQQSGNGSGAASN